VYAAVLDPPGQVQLGPFGIGQPERNGQMLHRGRSRVGDPSGLDVAHGPDADTGPASQLGLGQAGPLAQLAKPQPEIHRVGVHQIPTSLDASLCTPDVGEDGEPDHDPGQAEEAGQPPAEQVERSRPADHRPREGHDIQPPARQLSTRRRCIRTGWWCW
jgi:hypothetical protein